MAGTKELRDSEVGSGESARAQKMLEGADFETPAAEQVLVQSRSLTAEDAAFRAAVADVMRRVGARPQITNLHSLYALAA